MARGILRVLCARSVKLPAAAALSALALALVAHSQTNQPGAPQQAITAASLRGRVSFLASDALEGRGTPSHGLDVAAVYIASEFRRASLQTISDEGYFQIAPYEQVTERPEGLELSFSGAGEAARALAADRLTVITSHAVHLTNAAVFKWAPGTALDHSLEGKVLMLRAPSDPATVGKLALSRPDAIVQLVRRLDRSRGTRLTAQAQRTIGAGSAEPALVSAREEDLEAVFDRLPTGLGPGRLTLQIPEPSVTPARLANVIGVLPGSDPALKNQYVVVSAHYDHLGLKGKADQDRIYNGANDNASGVAAVLELADAFAAGAVHPKRTLVFACFFGEEEGLLGSRWYVSHPLFALKQTVMNFNFEQLGEPEANEGLPGGTMGITGFDFTDTASFVGDDFKAAGVELKDVRHNDDYFERSDNLSFAEAGVPAHTFAAAFDFPDYHKPSDEWPKLNYENMAKLTRGLAVAIEDVADRTEVPHWNGENKKAREYADAWRAMHP